MIQTSNVPTIQPIISINICGTFVYHQAIGININLSSIVLSSKIHRHQFSLVIYRTMDDKSLYPKN